MLPVLELKKIDKRFDSVHALKEVSFEIMPGETLSLVGENGAGKSTLMKILTGVYTKDSGEIWIDGKKANIGSPLAAKKLGIGQVYQQAELIPELTVAENIFLGETGFGNKGLVSWNSLYSQAGKILENYNIPIDATEKIKNLNVANRQMIAIAKVLQRHPKILILDEPTAVLSDLEVELLIKIINKLKENKVTIIYISHKLDEVFRLSDRIAIMRDGSLITVLDNKGLTKENLITHMLGRKVDAMFPDKKEVSTEEIVMEAKNLTSDKVTDISFKLRKGEILGIAGLVGSGRTELARALYGLDRVKAGELFIKGKKSRIRGPVDAVKCGLFLAPEDRRGQALVLVRSISDNVSLSNLNRISKFMWCNSKKEGRLVNGYKKDLNIKAENIKALTGHLSGGNQQKVVIAKALLAEPDILIFDEPTQGIDVGAKSEIYALLEQLKQKGLSIIFISSEMEELQGTCSRILVMRHGRITGEVNDNSIADSEKILSLMYRS
ncbi:MAG TPA: sugar ABC transporter ATP-binding protein [Bacillota bacterium]|nr:sugar ABC transporter ATP-binding protein [Bacillota bacterium]